MSIAAQSLPAAVEIIPAEAPAGAITVPWLAAGQQTVADDPTFELGDSGLAVRGWVAVSDTALLLRVTVADSVHANPYTASGIWKGDCLQVGIDARGDGCLGADPQTAGLFGPDDMALAVALTDNGPQGFIFFTQAEKVRGAMPAEWLGVTRDEGARVTDYRLEIPWSALGTPPGAFPSLGMAVQINDGDQPAGAQKRLAWGAGADGQPRPGLFKALRPGSPAGSLVVAAPGRDTTWGIAHRAGAAVGIHTGGQAVITARVGQEQASRVVPAGSTGRHFRVRVAASAIQGADAALSVAVAEAGNPEPVLEFTQPLKDPQYIYAKLVDVLDALLEESPHAVFTRHVQSVKAMAAQEWARLVMYADANPTEADAVLAAMESLHRGFEGECGEWAAYLDGRRSLVHAFLSPTDGTLQSYYFCLPKDWDPGRSYPLFFELHGAGNPNAFSGIANRLGDNPQAMNLRGYSAPKTYAEIQRNGYWIHPHGRGNLGYRGIGETDIWEAYADAAAQYAFDPDRQYLYGFSMGGGGTWSIALRTPDRWAAIAIMAGGTWREDADIPIAQNINRLPVFIWCGEQDDLFPHFLRMKGQLEQAGADMVVETTPGLGHNYTADIQRRTLDWMQQHTRRRPDRFRFIADTPEHSEAWGIRLKREPLISGAPAYACAIEGAVVHLDTTGTSAAKIDAGPTGLDLPRPYTVIWNGTQVYSGDADRLLLANGTGIPFNPAPPARWQREQWEPTPE